MAVIGSDLSTFTGERNLASLLRRELAGGGKMALSDLHMGMYLWSKQITDTYPNRATTMDSQKFLSMDFARGLIANLKA